MPFIHQQIAYMLTDAYTDTLLFLVIAAICCALLVLSTIAPRKLQEKSKLRPHRTTRDKITHLASKRGPTFSTTFLGTRLFHVTTYESACKILTDKDAGGDKVSALAPAVAL